MTVFFRRIAQTMSVLGGVVLSLVVAITVLSIIGRTGNSVMHSAFAQTNFAPLAQWLLDIGLGPIKGDFELVEAMMAFAIFAFLPLAQMTGAHASVDIFTAWLPRRAQLVQRILIEALFAVVLVVIALQLKEGMDSKLRSGQTTFILGYPLWWAYAASLCGAVVAAVVAVYMALVRVTEGVTGRILIADEMGADH